eukprot:scaffold741_cov79-Phaeocystis_antarctica.AAC.2
MRARRGTILFWSANAARLCIFGRARALPAKVAAARHNTAEPHSATTTHERSAALKWPGTK